MPATAQIMLLAAANTDQLVFLKVAATALSHSLVQNVQLLSRCILFQQLACDFSFGGKDNSILG
jgi:hypothetical protein